MTAWFTPRPSSVRNGAGITLGGANTYTGSTTINSGATLTLSSSGVIATSSGLTDNGSFTINAAKSIKTLSGSGTVALGAGVLTLTAATGTFSGVISSTTAGNGVTVASGLETLSGANTYTGATTISSGGTLALSGSGAANATSGVADGTGGTLDISQTAGVSLNALTGGGTVLLGSQTLTLTPTATDSFTPTGGIKDGGIGGGTGGGLTIGGTSNVTLGGGTANTYSGATTINNGATLSIASANSISANTSVVNNGSLVLTGAQTFKSLSIGQTATITVAANTVTLTAGNGTIAGAYGTGGGGLLIVQGGTETVSSTGTLKEYGGVTIGNSATPSPAEMILDGLSKSSISVLSMGTLSGSGSINGSAVAYQNLDNKGVVAPGDAALGAGHTTLTVANGFTNEAAGVLTIDAAGASNHGILSVAGAATLGGTVDIEAVNGFSFPNATTDLLDVLSYHTYTGNFTGLEFDGATCTAAGTDIWACGAHISITEVFTTNGTTAGQLNLDVAVPEPSSFAVLGAGLAGLFGFGMRRRRS